MCARVCAVRLLQPVLVCCGKLMSKKRLCFGLVICLRKLGGLIISTLREM